MASSKSSVPSRNRNRGFLEEFTTLALFFAKKRKNKGPLLESEIHELIETWKNTKETDFANLVLPTKIDYMQLAMDCIDGLDDECDLEASLSNTSDASNNIEDMINQFMANPDCPVMITPIHSCAVAESTSPHTDDKTTAIVSQPAQVISTDFMQISPQISKTSQQKSASCTNNKAGPSKPSSSHQAFPDHENTDDVSYGQTSSRQSFFSAPVVPKTIHEKFIGLFEDGLDEYKKLHQTIHEAFEDWKQIDEETNQKVTEVIKKLQRHLKQETMKTEDVADVNCKNKGGKRRQEAGESSEGLPVQKKSKMEVGEGTSSQSENMDERIRNQMSELFSSMIKCFNDS